MVRQYENFQNNNQSLYEYSLDLQYDWNLPPSCQIRELEIIFDRAFDLSKIEFWEPKGLGSGDVPSDSHGHSDPTATPHPHAHGPYPSHEHRHDNMHDHSRYKYKDGISVPLHHSNEYRKRVNVDNVMVRLADTATMPSSTICPDDPIQSGGVEWKKGCKFLAETSDGSSNLQSTDPKTIIVRFIDHSTMDSSGYWGICIDHITIQSDVSPSNIKIKYSDGSIRSSTNILQYPTSPPSPVPSQHPTWWFNVFDLDESNEGLDISA